MAMPWYENAFRITDTCVGKPAANGGLLSQRPIMRSFDVLLVVSLNKLLNTITLRSFETPSLMWHHSIVQIDIFRFKWGIIVSNDILKSNESIWGQLTYLPRTKWPPFWQTTISNAFFWMKMIEFLFEFVWNSFPGFQLTIASIGSLTHIYGTRERWVVNSLIFRETSYSEDRSWWFTSTIFTPQIPVMLPLTHWGPHKLAAILADDNFKCIFLNENDRIPIRICLKFVPRIPIDNSQHWFSYAYIRH